MACRLAGIKNKILVLSGKGGVGKSTVAVNLATALSIVGRKTGILDVDIHGPNVPKLLNLDKAKLEARDETLIPARFGDLKVMSLGFLVARQEDAIIWRGPLKMNVIQQFIKDVDWGELDWLVVDCPPGTGDEPLSIAQIFKSDVSAVIVTTPQDLAQMDSRKAVTFCRQLKIPVLGLIENMSGFTCPHCSKVVDIFKTGGGRRMAEEMDVPFLGSIPLDHRLVETGDAGAPFVSAFPDSPAAKAFLQAIKPIIESDGQ
ncbi:MAG TPA: Mrp/NBP35 family ATP-binding protein [Candidatus Brocadiia bacterium]|nr:Mrp/NBP35 family ATP-binding protein [Candidatus Brocadiia bacterium]